MNAGCVDGDTAHWNATGDGAFTDTGISATSEVAPAATASPTQTASDASGPGSGAVVAAVAVTGLPVTRCRRGRGN